MNFGVVDAEESDMRQYLGKKAGGPAINYASPAFGGMALRGTAARVVWQAPGKSETTCVERP